MSVTVLMLGTRRRNHFIQELRAAARSRDMTVSILGADTDRLDPFVSECDHFAVVPHHSHPLYESSLRELIVSSDVSLLIAWNDAEILRISAMDAASPLPCRLALPPFDAVMMMCDKLASYEWLMRAGIATPETRGATGIDTSTVRFPAVAKPRFGQGGVGVHICRSKTALDAAIEALGGEECLIQDFVPGDEYTVEVISFSGECVAAVPRRRLKVRGGEVMIAKVEMKEDLLRLAQRTCQVLGGSMVFNFQAIFFDGRWFVIELNPRFGGGADLSIAAGMDLPGAYLDIFVRQARPRPPSSIRDGLHMSRRFVSEFFLPEA